MKQSSFWEIESFNQPYDLIVIGAGIVGLSSALFYRRHRPQANILVVDKGSIPEGASTRNAGFACIGSITEHVSDMDKETEANIKNRIKRRYEGLQLLRETLGEDAIGYENCGGYEIFTTPEDFEQARRHVAPFNNWLSELTGEEDAYSPRELNGYHVIHNRVEGALHAGKMMQTLINNVVSSGTIIQWNTNITSLGETGELMLENGRNIKADQVLVATNAFTHRLLPEASVQPARGFVMVSEPWPDLPWKGTFNYDRGYIYFRHLNGRLLLGGGRNMAIDEETIDEFGTNETIKTYLHNFARDTLRMPADISFEYEWSGIMGFTPTKTPIMERKNEEIVIAAGLSGMGISIGMKVAETAAEILNEK